MVSKSVLSQVIDDVRASSILKIILTAGKSFLSSWPWIFFCMLMDLFFLVSVSAIVTVTQITLFEHLEALMRLTGSATGGLMNIYNQTEVVSSGLLTVTNSGEFQTHLTIIVKYLGLMVLGVFVAWILFQSLAWYAAYRMSTEKRQSFWVFMKNFIIESIPFFFLTVLWIFLSVKLLFSIKMSISPIMTEQTLNLLFALIVLITWYFGSLCYTITGRFSYQNLKQSFIYGTTKVSKVLQSFAFMFVLFVIIDLFLRIPFIRQDPFILMVIGTIIFMPAIVFSRLLLFKTRQEYWPETVIVSKKHK